MAGRSERGARASGLAGGTVVVAAVLAGAAGLAVASEGVVLAGVPVVGDGVEIGG